MNQKLEVRTRLKTNERKKAKTDLDHLLPNVWHDFLVVESLSLSLSVSRDDVGQHNFFAFYVKSKNTHTENWLGTEARAGEHEQNKAEKKMLWFNISVSHTNEQTDIHETAINTKQMM